jgi:hypothetical protein
MSVFSFTTESFVPGQITAFTPQGLMVCARPGLKNDVNKMASRIMVGRDFTDISSADSSFFGYL